MDVTTTGGKWIPRSDLQNRGRVLDAAILIDILKEQAVFPDIS
jgi:hypothetical protein